MTGITKKAATILLSLALIAPCLEAQHRTSGNRNGSRSEQVSRSKGGNKEHGQRPSATRPSNNGRPSNTTSRPTHNPGTNRPGNGNHNVNRPGNNGNHNWGQGNKPGNNGNHNVNRPGNNGNHNWGQGNKPGNNGNHNVNRPGNNGNHNWGQGNKPGNNGNHNGWTQGRPNRPNPGIRPGHNARPPHHVPARPGHGYRPPYVHRPPMNIHRPIPRPWHRPVPPPAWRPRPGSPIISSIFGINFGTTLNISLNFLLGNGYTVASYGNNAVYLNDVNQYNYYWPEATMYYGNNGLERTEFFYSTGYPDTARYMNLYNNMVSIYGSPVNVSNVSSSLSATWFAPNQGYIRLQYTPQYSSGQLRFFTTITTGL